MVDENSNFYATTIDKSLKRMWGELGSQFSWNDFYRWYDENKVIFGMESFGIQDREEYPNSDRIQVIDLYLQDMKDVLDKIRTELVEWGETYRYDDPKDEVSGPFQFTKELEQILLRAQKQTQFLNDIAAIDKHEMSLEYYDKEKKQEVMVTLEIDETANSVPELLIQFLSKNPHFGSVKTDKPDKESLIYDLYDLLKRVKKENKKKQPAKELPAWAYWAGGGVLVAGTIGAGIYLNDVGAFEALKYAAVDIGLQITYTVDMGKEYLSTGIGKVAAAAGLAGGFFGAITMNNWQNNRADVLPELTLSPTSIDYKRIKDDQEELMWWQFGIHNLASMMANNWNRLRKKRVSDDGKKQDINYKEFFIDLKVDRPKLMFLNPDTDLLNLGTSILYKLQGQGKYASYDTLEDYISAGSDTFNSAWNYWRTQVTHTERIEHGSGKDKWVETKVVVDSTTHHYTFDPEKAHKACEYLHAGIDMVKDLYRATLAGVKVIHNDAYLDVILKTIDGNTVASKKDAAESKEDQKDIDDYINHWATHAWLPRATSNIARQIRDVEDWLNKYESEIDSFQTSYHETVTGDSMYHAHDSLVYGYNQSMTLVSEASEAADEITNMFQNMYESLEMINDLVNEIDNFDGLGKRQLKKKAVEAMRNMAKIYDNNHVNSDIKYNLMVSPAWNAVAGIAGAGAGAGLVHGMGWLAKNWTTIMPQ